MIVFLGRTGVSSSEEFLFSESVIGHLKSSVQALTLANKVVIIPGYGLAVAKAEAAVANLAATLRENGVTVKFAFHPVVRASAWLPGILLSSLVLMD